MRLFSAASCLSRIAAVALALALAGCQPPGIVMRYEPTVSAVPLNVETRPKIFLERVEDRTGGAAVTYGGIAEWKFASPLDESLREALRTEMRRLGIELVESRGQADALLHAAWVRSGIRNERGYNLADIAVTLSLKSPRGEDLSESTLLATSKPHGSIRGNVFSQAFTEALAAAMSQIGPLWESKQVFAKLSPGPAETASTSASARRGETSPPAVLSDVDELPRAAAAKRAKAYAIVIGIRQYRQDLPQAEFADADAKLFSRYLTQTLGYEPVNVVTLTNEQATKSDFEKYFESWLPNRVEKDAEVFIYFSGHGAPNPATGDAFLVPYDGDPTYLQKTGYPLKRLYAELGKLQAKTLTVVMDSCFSGAGGRSVLAAGARPLVTVALPEDIPGRLSVLSASAGDQISYGYREKGHGLFTYFILKALKDRAGKKEIDWRSLFDSAAPQVAAIARREYNADQVPLWKGAQHADPP